MRNRIIEKSRQKISVKSPMRDRHMINRVMIRQGAIQVSKGQIGALAQLNKLDQGETKSVLFASLELDYFAPVVSKQRVIFSRWDDSLLLQRTLLSEYRRKLDDCGVSWHVCGKNRKKE